MSSDSELGAQIEQIVSESEIDGFLRDCLESIRTKDDLVHFFRRFALYNRPFPGAVSILAGAFHLRTDLFLDLNDPVLDNADRSSIVASNIFFAAEDEYGSRNRLLRVTHRSMAQAVVREVVEFAGWSVEQFNDVFAREFDHKEMAEGLRKGYRVSSHERDDDLFLALGFHLGSERLADIEFSALDEKLSSDFPSFVKEATDKWGVQEVPIYSWIATHTAVEVEHYNYSLRAAGQAIDYYAGSALKRDEIVALILQGFQEFIEFQRIMFVWLKENKWAPDNNSE